jgi:hypothetical protein
MGDAVQRGDRLAVDQRIDGMLREASASPHPFAEWYATSFRVVRLQLSGHFAAAEAEARRGATLPAPGVQFATFVLALQLHGIHLAQERGQEHLDEFRTHAPADRPPIARVYVALFELRNDRRPDAEATFASVVADDLAAIPRDVNGMNTLVPLAELCVALGRADSAEVLYDHLVPFAALHSWIGASWLHNGAIAQRLGLLAELLGRHDDAEWLVRDAVDRNARMGAPAFVARSRFDLARLLRRRGGRAARTEAIGLLREAASEAERLEMPDLGVAAVGLLE